MMRCHELIFRFVDPLSNMPSAVGTFRRVDGGWLSADSEFFPDHLLVRARAVVVDEIACDVCGLKFENAQGLAGHRRIVHGEGKAKK